MKKLLAGLIVVCAMVGMNQEASAQQASGTVRIDSEHYHQSPFIMDGDLIDYSAEVWLYSDSLDSFRVSIFVDGYLRQRHEMFVNGWRNYSWDGYDLYPHSEFHTIQLLVEQWIPDLSSVDPGRGTWSACYETFAVSSCFWHLLFFPMIP